MGNNLRCGCKCQNKQNEDEMNFPQEPSMKAEKTKQSSDNFCKDDNIPNELQTKGKVLVSQSERSNDENIQMEVYDDNNLLNKEVKSSNKFKKHNPPLQEIEEDNSPHQDDKISMPERIENIDDIEDNNLQEEEIINTNKKEEIAKETLSNLKKENNVNTNNIVKESIISSLTEQFNKEEIEIDFDHNQMETLKKNLLLSKEKDPDKDIEVLTKEVQIEENKPNKINKPIDTTSKSKKEKQSSSNINNFFSKELQKEVEIEDPAMKSFFDHHKMHMKQSIQTGEDVDLSKVIDKISLHNTFLDDVLLYSDLLKLIHNDNLSKPNNRKYTSRFCAVTKTEFKYYQTKENFITLQKAVNEIEFTAMKKVSLITFENDSTISDNSKKFGMKNTKKNKCLYNFIIIYSTEYGDNYEIFASENEEIVNKWVAVINYFIDSLNNL